MSGSVGVWGRLAALLVLCAMLSVVLAVAGPSADAEADWNQVGADIDGEAAFDYSGSSVAMNDVGDTIIIGAHLNDGNGDASGQARVFTLTDGAWNQVGDDIDGEAAGDWSSYSVAMNDVGDTVIIGAPLNDGNGDDSGQARVFTLIDGAWNQVGGDIEGEAANDYFGWSVAMNNVGDTVIIGAAYNDGNGEDSGHVRVFRSAPTPTPTPTATPQPTARPGPTPTPEPAGAQYGSGTVPNPVAASPETPTAEPAAATSAAGDGVAGPADTGTSTTTLAYLAVGLIAFGALLVPAIRRRN